MIFNQDFNDREKYLLNWNWLFWALVIILNENLFKKIVFIIASQNLSFQIQSLHAIIKMDIQNSLFLMVTISDSQESFHSYLPCFTNSTQKSAQFSLINQLSLFDTHCNIAIIWIILVVKMETILQQYSTPDTIRITHYVHSSSYGFHIQGKKVRELDLYKKSICRSLSY